MSDKYISKGFTGLEVAVIGMAGRFPGSDNIDEFWNNLKEGKEAITFFSDQELLEAGINPETLSNPIYVKAASLIKDIHCFDANFFNYTPGDAELIDPQVRIFLECTWIALEDAGYNPDNYKGLIGLYAGASGNIEWESRVWSADTKDSSVLLSKWQLSEKDFLSTHISYKLNLRGPSITVYTACSTSLAAIHMAYRALLYGECSMALAGGVTAVKLSKSGYLFQEGMINSMDGHCRTFDAQASGTIFGDGTGVVVLKRLKNAIEDNDHTYAVIKGSFINNDGSRKMGYTAPSIDGQAEVIGLAQRMARVEPESITYIEAHGTATALGDPMEIEALKQAFKTNKKNYCAIGSTKSNVGHLDIAAGIAGFIKTVMALKHCLIPPSLFFEKSNPGIDFENSPFYINNRLNPWKRDGYPLRAGVSSFGIGGTNVHIILEETPPLKAPLPSRQSQIILISAKTETALEQITLNFRDHLERNHQHYAQHGLADAAYTLQVGRRALKYRRMLVCANNQVKEVIKLLSTPAVESRKVKTYICKEDNPTIVFMFAGLGGQYVNMGRDIYEKEPYFHQQMDRCFDILRPFMDCDIKETLYPSPVPSVSPVVKNQTAPDINHFEIAQLIIFIFEYALAKLLIQWGIKPRAMMGYSFGEYTAACISGVFSLEDALKLVAARGRLIQKMPEGAMSSVPLPKNHVEPMLDDRLSLAIDNGPSCIISGPVEAVEAFENQMKKKKIMCMRVPASRAIHSKMTDPILKEFRDVLDTIPMNKPQIPYISNVTGDWLTDEQAANPGYWTRQLKQTVRFDDGMKRMTKKSNDIFIEIGPGHDISALIARHFQENSKDQNRVINLVRPQRQSISDVYFLLNKIGQLWLYGQPIDWSGFYLHEKRQRVPVPTYPFERQSYRIDDVVRQEGGEKFLPGDQPEKSVDFADWFYTMSWKQSLRLWRERKKATEPSIWMVFIGEHSLGTQLALQLTQNREYVTVVKVGTGFKKVKQGEYEINPQNKDDYVTLLAQLKESGKLPNKIIHLWEVTDFNGEGAKDLNNELITIDNTQELGFYSLLYLTSALARLGFSRELQMVVVTNNVQSVTGKEKLCPGKSTILGPLKVIPQEHSYIICRSVDITLAEPGELPEGELIQQLFREFTGDSSETVIAYRGAYRWVQTFDPQRLEEEGPEPAREALKEKGVYLLIGGYGRVGLELAEYLIRQVKARLVLTGRSDFPTRNQWNQWLDSHDDMHPISTKIKKLQQLEEMGGQILMCNVDIADYHRMYQAVTRVESQWGPINGVIHLAGITQGPSVTSIDRMEKNQCREQFRAKIYGVLVLEKIFREKTLDFCWLISSMASVLGGLGYTAYSAANNFMDVFVKYYNRLTAINKTQWLSINWDILEPEQMKSAFERILPLKKVNQVLISNGGRLQQRIDRWIKLESVREDKTPVKKATSYPRPHLMSPYKEPTNSYEMKIVDIWQNLFGFESIGTQDDFFELGGDSLKAITVIAQVHKELNVEIPIGEFFDHPTIQELAGYINRTGTTFSAVQPVEKKEYYPLSSAQERFYFLQKMDLESTVYNNPFTITLGTKINKQKLERAFKKLIDRHESLRTSFGDIDGKVVQVVHGNIDFTLEYHALSEDQLSSLAAAFTRTFDLTEAPLFRAGLMRLEEEKYVFILDMHHLITDGVSINIFIKEIIEFYSGSEFPLLRLQYKDFCQWQQDQLDSGKLKKQEEYWLKRLSGELPVLNMPTDYPRPDVQSFEGEIVTFYFDKELTRQIKDLIKETGTTLYMVILALYNILLSKYTEQEEIIIGSPIAGRHHADLGDTIGVFLETLVSRNYPRPEKSFEEFLREVKVKTLEDFENREYPLGELLKRLRKTKDLSRNPLFDAMLIVQNISKEKSPAEVTIGGLNSFPDNLELHRVSKVDLTLEVYEKIAGLLFNLEYCTKLFNRETMESVVNSFKEITSAVLENPKIKLRDIRLSHDLGKASANLYTEAESEFEF